MQKSINVLIAQEKVYERKLHKTEREAERLLIETKKEADKTALAIKKEVDESLVEEILTITRAHEENCAKLEEQTKVHISRVNKKEKYLPELAKNLAKQFVEEVLVK